MNAAAIIVLAFSLAGTGIALVVARSRLGWVESVAFVSVLPGLGLLMYMCLPGLRGSPSSAPPPSGLLVSAVIREPEAVFVWLVPEGEDEPRSYRLPYSRPLAEAMQALLDESQRRGSPIGVEWGHPKAPAGERAKGEHGGDPIPYVLPPRGHGIQKEAAR